MEKVQLILQHLHPYTFIPTSTVIREMRVLSCSALSRIQARHSEFILVMIIMRVLKSFGPILVGCKLVRNGFSAHKCIPFQMHMNAWRETTKTCGCNARKMAWSIIMLTLKSTKITEYVWTWLCVWTLNRICYVILRWMNSTCYGCML